MNRKTNIIIALFVLLCAGTGLAYWLSAPSLDKMVGQMIMTGFHGDGNGENQESFIAIEEQIRKGHVGGVILFDVDVSGLVAQGMTIPEAKKHIFSSNIKNTNQVQALTTHLQSITSTPLLIAIDQEGGNIQRLKPEHGFSPIPSAKQMAKTDVKTTYNVAYDLGTRLYNLGINVDFAPSADVDVNPKSPAIGALERSFSSDPNIVTEFGKAFSDGLNDANIVSSFKHFPGHGSATGDTHAGLTDITKTYQDYELEPWKALLTNASPLTTVMVAHVVNNNFDTLPASLSGSTIQMIRDMGFDGVIFSDDMDMGAIVNQYGREKAIEMAINAGNDILVFGNNLSFDANRGEEVNKTIVKLVHQGKIKRSRIRQSYNRIMNMKKHMRNKSNSR